MCRGLSASEMMLQRDMYSGAQIPVDDEWLIDEQQEAREVNHTSSHRSKMKGNVIPVINHVYINTPLPRRSI